MKQVVIYFHGFNSSQNSSKSHELSKVWDDTYAWDINVDPAISLPFLMSKIDDVMMNHLNDECEFIFVGSSLGGWFAANFANIYACKAVLINPSYNPKESLAKYGIAQDIRDNYLMVIEFSPLHKVFIGTADEVIDFSGVDFGYADVTYVNGANHRFDGHFDLVIDYIKNGEKQV